MVVYQLLLTIIPGIAITVFILLANYFQWKVRRRFSGVIGKIMYWYSFGLAALLALTIWHWLVVIFDMNMGDLLWGDIAFFLIAAIFFFKGSSVIR
jgi:dolichol kinase